MWQCQYVYHAIFANQIFMILFNALRLTPCYDTTVWTNLVKNVFLKDWIPFVGNDINK